jgi:hypothetical protein
MKAEWPSRSNPQVLIISSGICHMVGKVVSVAITSLLCVRGSVAQADRSVRFSLGH